MERSNNSETLRGCPSRVFTHVNKYRLIVLFSPFFHISPYLRDFSKLHVGLAALLCRLHCQFIVVHKRSVNAQLAGLVVDRDTVGTKSQITEHTEECDDKNISGLFFSNLVIQSQQ